MAANSLSYPKPVCFAFAWALFIKSIDSEMDANMIEYADRSDGSAELKEALKDPKNIRRAALMYGSAHRSNLNSSANRIPVFDKSQSGKEILKDSLEFVAKFNVEDEKEQKVQVAQTLLRRSKRIKRMKGVLNGASTDGDCVENELLEDNKKKDKQIISSATNSQRGSKRMSSERNNNSLVLDSVIEENSDLEEDEEDEAETEEFKEILKEMMQKKMTDLRSLAKERGLKASRLKKDTAHMIALSILEERNLKQQSQEEEDSDEEEEEDDDLELEEVFKRCMSMKVTELRADLREVNLPTLGHKAELAARLANHIFAEEKKQANSEQVPSPHIIAKCSSSKSEQDTTIDLTQEDEELSDNDEEEITEIVFKKMDSRDSSSNEKKGSFEVLGSQCEQVSDVREEEKEMKDQPESQQQECQCENEQLSEAEKDSDNDLLESFAEDVCEDMAPETVDTNSKPVVEEVLNAENIAIIQETQSLAMEGYSKDEQNEPENTKDMSPESTALDVKNTAEEEVVEDEKCDQMTDVLDAIWAASTPEPETDSKADDMDSNSISRETRLKQEMEERLSRSVQKSMTLMSSSVPISSKNTPLKRFLSSHRDSVAVMKSSGKFPKVESKLKYEVNARQSERDETLTEQQLKKLEVDLDEIEEFEKQELQATTSSSSSGKAKDQFLNTSSSSSSTTSSKKIKEKPKKILMNIVRPDQGVKTFIDKKEEPQKKEKKLKPKVPALERARLLREKQEQMEKERQLKKQRMEQKLREKKEMARLAKDENQNQNIANETLFSSNKVSAALKPNVQIPVVENARRKYDDESKEDYQSDSSYAITEGYHSDSDEEYSIYRKDKSKPKWASGKNLVGVLIKQENSRADGDDIFGLTMPAPNVDLIFNNFGEERRKQAKIRGSSAKWEHDGVTLSEVKQYKIDMKLSKPSIASKLFKK